MIIKIESTIIYQGNNDGEDGCVILKATILEYLSIVVGTEIMRGYMIIK